MSTAVINGITIDYEIEGPDDGEPVLLIMGLGAQLVVWPQGFVSRLSDAGYRVIRFDNRDVGRSSRIDAPMPTIGQMAAAFVVPRRAHPAYTLVDMAGDAAGLLDHLGIGRAHVVGASMGGMIAQELAIAHPERVATLTSIMSNTGKRFKGAITPSLLPALARARAAGSDGRELDDVVTIERLISGPHFDETASRALAEITTVRQGDPAEAAAGLARQTMAVAVTRDRTDDLQKLDIPTLVVHGLVDKLVRPSGGVATAMAVPGARLVMYPDMGHDVPAARHAECAHQILCNFRRSPITQTAAAEALTGH
ncbi:MAG: alpha/beta fold hydrolase [Aquihabitans sp.]